MPLFYEKKPVDDDYLALLGHTGPLPSFKDLPGLDINPTQLAALEVNLLVTELSRVFIMQENVPADIAQYWQSQFDLMMVDPRIHRWAHHRWVRRLLRLRQSGGSA